MPRGNDASAAAHDLADKFGRGTGNAEQLIEASLARSTTALRAAEMLPRHPEATKEAQERLVNKKVDGNKIIDAAVRGGVVTAVVEDEQGRRWVIALDDHGKPVDEDGGVPTGGLEANAPMDPHDKRRKNPGQPDAPEGTV